MAAVPIPNGLAIGGPRVAGSLNWDKTSQTAGQVLLVSALSGLISVRVVAGLLLALGPIFIACLLFDATRGIFEGWVRGLLASAFGAVFVNAVLGFELAIVEPQITALIQGREAQVPMPQLPGQILATAILFAIVLLAALIGIARVAASFRIPAGLRRELRPTIERYVHRESNEVGKPTAYASATPAAERPRALAVADAIASVERRELQREVRSASAPRSTVVGLAHTGDTVELRLPLGQTQRRSTSQRRSATAGRRDAR